MQEEGKVKRRAQNQCQGTITIRTCDFVFSRHTQPVCKNGNSLVSFPSVYGALRVNELGIFMVHFVSGTPSSHISHVTPVLYCLYCLYFDICLCPLRTQDNV